MKMEGDDYVTATHFIKTDRGNVSVDDNRLWPFSYEKD